MNTPNKLTVLRIALVPALLFFLLVPACPSRFLWAIFVFILAAVTDHIDGKLARKTGQVTDFGKFLDPLADKILVLAALVSFVQMDLVGALPVVIILVREFLVTSVRLAAMGEGEVISANFWGKLKTVTQILAIFMVLLVQFVLEIFPEGAQHRAVMEGAGRTFVWISLAFTVFSGAVYVKENLKYIKADK